MTTSQQLVAAIAISTALATPAFAQWRSPAAPEALHPSDDRNVAATHDATAQLPSATSPRPTVIRATKGQ